MPPNVFRHVVDFLKKNQTHITQACSGNSGGRKASSSDLCGCALCLEAPSPHSQLSYKRACSSCPPTRGSSVPAVPSTAMKQRLLPSFVNLLLAALLLPGSSSASSINHLVTEPPSSPQDEFPAQGGNGSGLLHHRVKRFPPRTPPYHEPGPNYQIVNCKKNEGFCQKYCNFMETQVGYCSKKKEACCLHPF
uniref:Beta-defensin-like domain-containing protein n=1 Tax=Rattus norvegicus TaxID=10116 RepID=A0ABK0LNM1_RAT